MFLYSVISFVIIYVILKIVKYLSDKQHYWADRDIKFVPGWPLFGNFLDQVLRRRSMADIVTELYKAFPNERYVGTTQFVTPMLLIRDLELLKRITIKDFDHFTDHRGGDLEEIDPLLTKNLFLLTGQKWKDMRSTLSPTFTTSKMRAMFTLMQECGKEFVDHFAKKDTTQVIEVEMKKLLCCYTNDVIATCAFGYKVNSLNDRDNEFYRMGEDATDFSGWRGLKFLLLISSPAILKLLRLPVLPKRVTRFFRRVVEDTIAYRETTQLIRPDMIHLLMEAKKGNVRHEEADQEIEETGFATITESHVGRGRGKLDLTNEDIAAQVVIFFFAGFDSAATVMSFLSYELALNEDVQERLQREVDETLKSGEATYEKIARMKYLDMVISEHLRKWPPGVLIDRVCVKDYTIEPELPTEKQIVIEKGSQVSIPIFAIHRDPNYYPNPEKFDPERFSDENKGNIIPYSYLPFGIGPRSCIGNRFALLEVKVLIFYLLSKFSITVTKKTVIPLILNKSHPNLASEGGFYLGLKRRT